MNRAEQAVTYKHNGNNCAQAVLLAFQQEIPEIDETTLRALGSGFGVGMGSMEATCGALLGANMVLGLKNDSGKPTMPQSRDLLQQFQSISGDTICKNLKGIETGVVLCDCDDCVRNAVRILEEKLGL